MDLASYMVVATCVVFALGAAVALAWSVAAGHWTKLDATSRLVLADDDPSPAPSGQTTLTEGA